MRLVCPNCGAQYDVPLEVIPEAGRDVQCSNCGHTWFQRRVTQPMTTAPPPPPATESWHQTPEMAPPPVADPEPKRTLDPDMAELFREEREYEERQRSVGTLETQPDLGLEPPSEDEQARRARESRERMARMRGEDLPQSPATVAPIPAPPAKSGAALEAAAAAAAAASRRELLPDVDEINQTLRASSEPRVIDSASARAADDGAARQTGSPFARGLVLMVLLAVLAVAAYVFAPRISADYPQVAPYLDTYVETVDSLRFWLDGQVKALLASLDQMSSEAGGADPGAAPPAPQTDN
jgi:predicted Zn finger-like uncharacterized protein